MTSRPKIIFGGAVLSDPSKLDQAREYLAICKRYGVKEIDTARAYPGSEAVLGHLKASESFIVDTKIPGVTPRNHSRGSIFTAQKKSFEDLQVESVDIYFLHAPDPATPIAEVLAAMNELYVAGRFKRFGLSNYSVAQISSIYEHCKEHGYMLPTVYQGNYNPVSRHIEKDLFPFLRGFGIEFHAYSPIAGGFLAKSVQSIEAGGTGRWDPDTILGKLYHGLYNRPTILEGLKEWHEIAGDAGVAPAELAFRYMAYHSFLSAALGDAIVVGATTPEQLLQTMEGLERGPLPEDVLARIERVWELVKGEAPIHSLDSLNLN